jgi:diaminohydroxyphosphoribosylaminopyrimidine deaminase/5-amino-6-(5-phosphoribosylamino)uracil reductase
VTPEAAMRRALGAARRAEGRSHPNPPVGAICFRGDQVLGTGATRPVGGPHAEVVALEAAQRRHGHRPLRGASMAVTLEPCCHRGRTGPCTDEIVAAGIRRVFVGHADPHPGVAGLGIRQLRRAGIDVRVGVLDVECRAQHRGFLSVCQTGRPFTMLKLASSLDGRIATGGGESRWITGPEARTEVHRLRARVDAIVVGSETVLADDPELTARRNGHIIHRPIRVVVDSRLRVPKTARLHRGEPAASWVLCGPRAAARRKLELEKGGVRLLEVPLREGRLNLKSAFSRLAREGLTQILIEGGGGLAAALLRSRLIDEVHWFAAPRLLGAEGRPSLGALGLAALPGTPTLDARVKRLGPDVYIHGPVRYPARRRGGSVRRRTSR